AAQILESRREAVLQGVEHERPYVGCAGLAQPTQPAAALGLLVPLAASGRRRPVTAAYAGQVREELRLRQVPYEHPDVTALTAAANEFYTEIYGGPDETPFTTAEFTPPHGTFLVGYLDGEAVAMGGWRFRPPGVPRMARRPAEIKRMFVQERVRGRGFARIVLA